MINQSEIKKIFNNKTVLITGGTGSFGSTMLNKIVNLNCKIKIFSRDELKQDLLRSKIKSKNVDFIIGDVRDKKSINYAMKGVDIVFHAAALKQVPSCEFFPDQAAATNIVGSKNVFSAAIDNEVSKVVDVPVIASGGAGTNQHILDAFLIGRSDAVLAASIFHFGELKIKDVKKFLNSNKVSVRL